MSAETGPISPARLIQILAGLGVPINAQLAAILAQLDVALSTRASEATVAAILAQLAAVLAKMDNPADPMTADVLDRAVRLVGVVYGSQAQQLLQRAVSFDLEVQLRTAGVEYDARQVRALTAADIVDVSDRAARLLGTVSPVAASTWDVSDRAARLLGVVYGSAASLLQATPADALANPANALAAAIFPHVFDATAGDWNRWLESPTQGIPYVEERPAGAISVLADVVAAAAATQLIAASTPCRAVVVRALRANTGNVRVGGAGVLVGSGAELSAGDSISLAINNVNLVYIFGNGTDSVSVTYVV